MRARTLAVGLAALAAVLLGGCAGDSGEGDQEPAPSPTTEAPSTPPSVPATPGLPTVPSLPPRDGELTITGEVIEGVEAGCRLLQTDSGDYLLFGETVAELQMGGTVTLRGRVQPDVMSTCQQGTPFVVLEVLD